MKLAVGFSARSRATSVRTLLVASRFDVSGRAPNFTTLPGDRKASRTSASAMIFVADPFRRARASSPSRAARSSAVRSSGRASAPPWTP